MGNPVFAAYSYTNGGSGAITVAAADLGGVNAGDVLIAFLGNASGTLTGNSAASGFTSRYSNAFNATADQLWTYTAPSTPPTTWGFTTPTAYSARLVVAKLDQAIESSIKVSTGSPSGSTATPTTPAIAAPTTASDFELAFLAFKLPSGTVTVTTPPGLTGADSQTSGWSGVAWAWKQLTASGSTGTLPWSLSTAQDTDTVQITMTGTSPAPSGVIARTRSLVIG